jgi:hypothetical protein
VSAFFFTEREHKKNMTRTPIDIARDFGAAIRGQHEQTTKTVENLRDDVDGRMKKHEQHFSNVDEQLDLLNDKYKTLDKTVTTNTANIDMNTRQIKQHALDIETNTNAWVTIGRNNSADQVVADVPPPVTRANVQGLEFPMANNEVQVQPPPQTATRAIANVQGSQADTFVQPTATIAQEVTPNVRNRGAPSSTATLSTSISPSPTAPERLELVDFEKGDFHKQFADKCKHGVYLDYRFDNTEVQSDIKTKCEKIIANCVELKQHQYCVASNDYMVAEFCQMKKEGNDIASHTIAIRGQQPICKW